MRTPIFNLSLKDSYMISQRVKHFVFTTSALPKVDFIPGQFISFHLDFSELPMKRSYSIASMPSENTIDIAVTKVDNGQASNYLFNLKNGATLTTSGPYGKLILPVNTKKQRIFLLGTGTGISPYRSMLEQIKANLTKHDDHTVIIAQGVRNKDNLLYEKDFLALDTLPNYSFKVFYSRHIDANTLLSHESKGYVQSVLKDYTLTSQDHIYVCGSPNMIQDTVKYLEEVNFQGSLYREKYYSA